MTSVYDEKFNCHFYYLKEIASKYNKSFGETTPVSATCLIFALVVQVFRNHSDN